MKPRTLSESEFRSTFGVSMRDATADAEEIVDLWAYADQAIAETFPDTNDWEWRVDRIYESSATQHQHVLLPAPRDNAYIVIVIGIEQRAIVGHHLLDLNALYGISP